MKGGLDYSFSSSIKTDNAVQIASMGNSSKDPPPLVGTKIGQTFVSNARFPIENHGLEVPRALCFLREALFTFVGKSKTDVPSVSSFVRSLVS